LSPSFLHYEISWLPLNRSSMHQPRFDANRPPSTLARVACKGCHLAYHDQTDSLQKVEPIHSKASPRDRSIPFDCFLDRAHRRSLRHFACSIGTSAR
jgi:hypothetical protein